jgi:hypothetical protein
MTAAPSEARRLQPSEPLAGTPMRSLDAALQRLSIRHDGGRLSGLADHRVGRNRLGWKPSPALTGACLMYGSIVLADTAAALLESEDLKRAYLAR